LNEFQALKELRHPNVTFVHDAFEYRDTFYLVIERCDSTLSKLITWAGLKPLVWVGPLSRHLLQSVDYIHAQGYVHKDIHPGNVYVAHLQGAMGEDHRATVFKLGDVGISRLEPDIDVFNTMLAKWMLPPEALHPTTFGTVDRRVDIYHTGLTLMSLVLRRVPSFSEGEILNGAPRQLAESIRHPIGPVLARALRRHTKDRYQSALDFWRDLKATGLQ
jgi:serine/threonine-protein kinase